MELTDSDIFIFESLEKRASGYFNIDIERVFSKDTSNAASFARGAIYYISHYRYMLSVGKIAMRYGRKVRGVKSQISKTKFLFENSNGFRNICDELCNEKEKATD